MLTLASRGVGEHECPGSLGVCCCSAVERKGSTWEFEWFELKLALCFKNKTLLFLFVWFVGRAFALLEAARGEGKKNLTAASFGLALWQSGALS